MLYINEARKAQTLYMSDDYFKLRYRYPSGECHSTASGSDLWMNFDAVYVEFDTSDMKHYKYGWSHITLTEDSKHHFIFNMDDGKTFIL